MQAPISSTNAVTYGGALAFSLIMSKKILTKFGFHVRLFNLQENSIPELPNYCRKVLFLALQIFLSVMSVLVYGAIPKYFDNRTLSHAVQGTITGCMTTIGLALVNCANHNQTHDQEARNRFIRQCISSTLVPSLLLGACLPTAISLQFCMLHLYHFQPQIISSSNLLKQHDLNHILHVLHHDLSHFKIQSSKLNKIGAHHLVAQITTDTNEEWIFRFPRSLEATKSLEREERLLKRVRPHLSLPTPRYLYTGSTLPFVGYKALLGNFLDTATYLAFSIEQRQHIADQLAGFLSELHRAMPAKEALQAGFPVKSLISLQDIGRYCLKLSALKAFTELLTQVLESLKHYPDVSQAHVLLHGDLHSSNFVMQAETATLTGVFDFSSAVIGHYALDFSALFFTHPDLAIRTATAYAKRKNVPNPIQLAAANHVLHGMNTFLHFQREKNHIFANHMLSRLKAFIPIWQENGWNACLTDALT